MSPLAELYLKQIWRTAGVWICMQPLLVGVAHVLPRGAELLEGELVVLAFLIALGLQGELSRERMEYLRHLPLERRALERVGHVLALSVLVAACTFCYLGELTGAVRFAWEHLAWSVLSVNSSGRESPPVWTPHWSRAPWLNVFLLPVLAYWLVTAVRRRLPIAAGGRAIMPVRAGVLLGLVLLGFFNLLLPGERRVEHDPWMRSAPGALALLVTWLLARRVLRRPERDGTDAYPIEEAAWES